MYLCEDFVTDLLAKLTSVGANNYTTHDNEAIKLQCVENKQACATLNETTGEGDKVYIHVVSVGPGSASICRRRVRALIVLEPCVVTTVRFANWLRDHPGQCDIQTGDEYYLKHTILYTHDVALLMLLE